VTVSEIAEEGRVGLPAGVDGGGVEGHHPFEDPMMEGGTFVFHCHPLGHEDEGMMATVRVGPSAPNDPLGTMTMEHAN
jgi:hypothetical protein